MSRLIYYKLKPDDIIQANDEFFKLEGDKLYKWCAAIDIEAECNVKLIGQPYCFCFVAARRPKYEA